MDMQSVQQPGQPAEAGIFSPNDAESANPANSEIPDSEKNSGFSTNPDQVEKEQRSNMSENQNAALDQFLKAGAEAIFGKDMHSKVMQGIENSKNIGNDVGMGAVAVTESLIKSSAGLAENKDAQAAILPAGTILIADMGEYLNKSGIKFTDEDFEEASHILLTHMGNRYDPAYRAKMEQYAGQQSPDQQIPVDEIQGAAQPGGGGLLNMTGRTGA